MASPEEPSGVLEARNTSPVSTLSSSTGGSAAKVSDSSTASGGLKDTENEPEPEAMSGGTEDTGVVFAAEGTDAAGGGTSDDGRRQSGRIRLKAEARAAAAAAEANNKRGALESDDEDGGGHGGVGKKAKMSLAGEEDSDEEEDDDAEIGEKVDENLGGAADDDECSNCGALEEDIEELNDELAELKLQLKPFKQWERLFKDEGGLKGAKTILKEWREEEERRQKLEKEHEKTVSGLKDELTKKDNKISTLEGQKANFKKRFEEEQGKVRTAKKEVTEMKKKVGDFDKDEADKKRNAERLAIEDKKIELQKLKNEGTKAAQEAKVAAVTTQHSNKMEQREFEALLKTTGKDADVQRKLSQQRENVQQQRSKMAASAAMFGQFAPVTTGGGNLSTMLAMANTGGMGGGMPAMVGMAGVGGIGAGGIGMLQQALQGQQQQPQLPTALLAALGGAGNDAPAGGNDIVAQLTAALAGGGTNNTGGGTGTNNAGAGTAVAAAAANAPAPAAAVDGSDGGAASPAPAPAAAADTVAPAIGVDGTQQQQLMQQLQQGLQGGNPQQLQLLQQLQGTNPQGLLQLLGGGGLGGLGNNNNNNNNNGFGFM